jgi:nitrate reductase gamma subunit
VSIADILLWIVLPYVAVTVFIAGHIWRYRRDQFGWTCRSTQTLESRWLAWGSNLFHYGALAAIAGHVLGILVPASVTDALHISEQDYHIISAGGGSVASAVCIAGLVILIGRRIAVRRVWVTTTYVDIAVYALLAIVIFLGAWDTVVTNTLGGGYDYRRTVGVWFRGLCVLQPQAQLMAAAPLQYQVHVTVAWLLYALWPFSRLVHAWSIPFQYLGRPYILYRRRYTRAAR